VIVYGTDQRPGSPGSWQRDIYVALHAAHAGPANGRQQRRNRPPFRYGRLLVTAGRPRLPYGRSTHGRGHLTHIPTGLLFAWRRGRLAGHMVAWECGSRTAYFRLMDEPDSMLCPVCVMTVGRRT
jgi:hypothetical protein